MYRSTPDSKSHIANHYNTHINYECSRITLKLQVLQIIDYLHVNGIDNSRNKEEFIEIHHSFQSFSLRKKTCNQDVYKSYTSKYVDDMKQ